MPLANVANRTPFMQVLPHHVLHKKKKKQHHGQQGAARDGKKKYPTVAAPWDPHGSAKWAHNQNRIAREKPHWPYPTLCEG